MADSPPAIEIDVPWLDGLTPYDEAHLALYLRILDAHARGAPLEVIARDLLGIDPGREAERARKAASSHLRRALWMSSYGYRYLLE